MKNLLKISGIEILDRAAQKQVMGGAPVGDFEDCHENDPGIGDMCFNNFDCAQNQACNNEGRCVCGLGQEGGCDVPLPFPCP